MGGMKISELDFVRLLPAFMRDDEAVIALSKAVNTLMGEPGKRLSTLRTWDKIDELNEAELDELAWELDIDWYDSTGMGLEEKRETIKLAQQIKRKRGTKWAVEQLITAYFGEGYVAEWFERGEAPYTFVALTPNTHVTEESIEKFTAAVNAAKNARSHLAGVLYYWKQGPDPGVEYALGTSRHVYDFPKSGTRDRAAVVGILVKRGMETEPEETRHLYGFTKAGAVTCGTNCGPSTEDPGIVGAAVKVSVETEPETSHAVYVFPKCGENCYNATHGVARVGTAIVGVSVVSDEL
jgi:phage tail P2-like protein